MTEDTVTISQLEYTALCLSAEVPPSVQPKAVPPQWEFDAPYELINHGDYFMLRAHGTNVASYSVKTWRSAQECIEAAWNRAYSQPLPSGVATPESYILTEEFCDSVKDLAKLGFTKERIDRLWKAIHSAAA